MLRTGAGCRALGDAPPEGAPVERHASIPLCDMLDLPMLAWFRFDPVTGTRHRQPSPDGVWQKWRVVGGSGWPRTSKSDEEDDL